MKGITFCGNISDVREIEDCIRASKRYTEGRLRQPSHPVQGDKFASRRFSKYYEVYPDTEVGWDMPAGAAIDLLWGDVEYVDVVFNYDYRCNEASVTVRGELRMAELLLSSIKGLCDLVRVDMLANGAYDKKDIGELIRRAAELASRHTETGREDGEKATGIIDRVVNFLTPGGRSK